MKQIDTHQITRLAALPVELVGRAFGTRKSRVAFLKSGLKAIAVAFGLLLLAVVVLTAIVFSGPTEFGFVRDRIASTLEATLGEGYAISVGSAVLEIDPVYGLVLKVDNVAVRDSRGAIVVNVPSTRLDIDPTSLLSFRINVPAIELNNAEISVVRAASGSIYLGNSRTAHIPLAPAPTQAEIVTRGGEAGFAQLVALFQVMDRGLEPAIDEAIGTGLRSFTFNNGTVELWDANRSERRRFPRADLAIAVDPATTALRANLSTIGHGGRWTAEFERDVDVSSGARTLSAVFSQLTLADIMPKLGDRSGRVTANIPLYGRARVRYDKDGAVEDATVRLDLGAGEFRFSGGRESVLLDEATVKLRWDVARNAIVVQPSTFFLGETRGVFVGSIMPEGDPALGRYGFRLESRGAILAPRDSTEPPLIAQRMQISGVADVPEKLITFDQALIQTAHGSVTAAGSLGFAGETPSLAVAASISEMPAWAAKQMWVPFLAPGGRRWFIEHVKAGRIASGEFEAAIPTAMLWAGNYRFSKDMLRLSLSLEDMAFATYGELPPIENASGVAVLAGTTFGVDLETGVINLPSGKTVAVNAGAFAIDDTARYQPEGLVEVELSGDAESLGAIADAKPFETLSKQDVAPADLSGTADATVSLQFPLREDVTEAEVEWRVSIDGIGLACAVPLEGWMVSDANVNIVVTPVDVIVRGKAKIDGVDADLDMNHPISGGYLAGDSGQQMFRLNLDDAARKRLGIGLEDVLAGSVATFVSNVENGEGQHYDLDLKNARLVLPGLGWSKGVGVPATLSFDLAPNDRNGYSVENLVLEGDDFGFSGTATLDAEYGIATADIHRFALRPGDSLRFKLRSSETGYVISARGETFDVRSLLRNFQGQGDGGSTPDVSVDANVERLTGYNDEVIRNGKVSMVSTGGVTRKLTFTGEIGDSDISASYSDGGNAATLSVESPEGGRIFRFADLYSRVSGGYLRVEGTRSSSSAPLLGSIELTNFAIVDEPVMKSVVSASASDPSGRRSGFDPNNVRFDRLVISFAHTDQAVTVREALLGGPAIGATFNGRIDLASSTVSINGTYLPAYQFNNLFGRLPIIGLALGAGSREGLIGVTFKIQGSTDDPRVFINPLSVVAPGIFRKIFEFQ